MGDRTYDHFCKFGKSLNKLLSNLGGNAVLPISKGDANANLESTYMIWRNEIVKLIQSLDLPRENFE